jgi:hypothetical protein
MSKRKATHSYRFDEALKLIKKRDFTVVDWTNCDIGDAGAVHFADALIVSQTLEELYLGVNGIGNEGTSKLAEALTVNQTLKLFDLSCNKITNEGMAMLAAALKYHNRTLKSLNVSFNNVDSGSALMFIDALEDNLILTYLYLDSIPYNSTKSNDRHIREAMEALLDRNRKIEKVVHDYTQRIVVPIVMEAVAYAPNSKRFNMSKYMDQLMTLTRETLFKGLSTKQIIALSEHLHDMKVPLDPGIMKYFQHNLSELKAVREIRLGGRIWQLLPREEDNKLNRKVHFKPDSPAEPPANWVAKTGKQCADQPHTVQPGARPRSREFVLC